MSRCDEKMKKYALLFFLLLASCFNSFVVRASFSLFFNFYVYAHFIALSIVLRRGTTKVSIEAVQADSLDHPHMHMRIKFQKIIPQYSIDFSFASLSSLMSLLFRLIPLSSPVHASNLRQKD